MPRPRIFFFAWHMLSSILETLAIAGNLFSWSLEVEYPLSFVPDKDDLCIWNESLSKFTFSSMCPTLLMIPLWWLFDTLSS